MKQHVHFKIAQLLWISFSMIFFSNVSAFTVPGKTFPTFPISSSPQQDRPQQLPPVVSRTSPKLSHHSNNKVKEILEPLTDIRHEMTKLMIACTISLSVLNINAPAALSYENYNDSFNNNDVDTVTNVVQSLRDASGDAAASFKVFESINEIITEGKGVGGMINSSGVKLQRGYVSDEDTTIYNPGLSLLTESEKETIVNAVIQNRRENISKNTWSTDNEFAFDFLKTKLDPLHMVELKGYLGILPFYGAGVYLVALAVQQFARDLFAPAYIVSAVAVFLPILVLVAKGV